MNLNQYLDSPGASIKLAKDLQVAPALVSQWRTGHRPVPVARCAAIERATGGAVTRRDLRPRDWWVIWPELETGTSRSKRARAA